MNSALDESHPNELFRFVNVRGPFKQPLATYRHSFVDPIYDRLDEERIRTIARERELLYPDLRVLDGVAEQLPRSIARVDAYRHGKEYLSSPADYAARFPALASFVDWLDANADRVSNDTVIATARPLVESPVIVEHGCRPVSDQLQLTEIVVWDNLLASLLRPTDPLLITYACKYLGTMNLLDLVKDRAQGHPERLGAVYRSRPILPTWFVKLTTLVDRKPDEGVDAAHANAPAVPATIERQKRYGALVETAAKVKALAAKNRGAALSTQETAPPQLAPSTAFGSEQQSSEAVISAVQAMPNPLRVAREELHSLGDRTVALLTELSGDAPAYDLEQLLAGVQREAASIAAHLGGGTQHIAIKVGNAIIDSKDFCANMIDEDPCGRRERKEFQSRGSFITTTLIGDLLVTKQQLVKYDLGEVAHVETAMAGLEKERVHRRLHRSEAFSLEESETVTEEERETQTTDRFDMEKESSKVIEQDFSVDTGVNVSGSYGAVQFNSTLDASYGYSSQQAQSEATSFSKEVTTRALSRVKERVRRMKTLTVTNEVEETSRHKLTNNTNDNINGVYRFLDKYTLNKIINYGKRLMFEFSIPEPGQFYLFRQIAKPKPASSIVNPDDPKTVPDPLGAPLRSPADITETNYTFWAARYGATTVEAPPAQFVRISRAWRSEYATSQAGDIYDAWSKDIELPTDYEATFAQVACDNYWWGSSGLHGALATTGFGGGYTTINLPPITRLIGVSLLSKGMAWKLNVIITLQRSAQLYSQWQIATYGKILDAYKTQKQQYESWLAAQSENGGLPFELGGNNPGINRQIEHEELKKRAIELFTGQRFESNDAAVNGIYNVSGYPEILFAEAIREGNLVKFFEQAFEWDKMTYIFYPYFWGRKKNWLSAKLVEDPADPLFTKFLQAGSARVVVPARPGFENFLMMFHIIAGFISAYGCAWNFDPAIFGALGISNTFSPGVNDPVYLSIAQELQSAAGYSEETGPIYGTPYVQKLPTNLVYIAQNSHLPNTPWPGLPDHSGDPDIAPYL